MKENVMERLEKEFIGFREYLVSGELGAAQLVGKAYEIAMKQFLVDALEQLIADGRVSDAVMSLLCSQDNVLDYLYALWLACDYSVIPGLEEAMLAELEYEVEV